ncbi:MAG TPA: ABC transporter ATP-binding protein, partial [Thermoanaerobaculia bacterium]
FLDEPTTGLDPQSRLQLWERIAVFKAAGRTVLLTTHYMEEAERLCDRVAIVDHGRIIALGTPAELIAGLNAPHIIEFSSEPAVDEDLLSAVPGAGERRQRDGRWQLAAANLAQAVPALLSALDDAGARLVSLSTHRATLEDVFLSLTGRELRDE